jgi:peptide-methionine (S)-S-oxide reductase
MRGPMGRRGFGLGLAVGLGALGLGILRAPARAAADALPPPALDVPPGGAGLQTAIFSGGCFWGVQGVFEHVRGVTEALSGYTGGSLADPSYEQVSSGTTGHAESVRVSFDPRRVTYGKLLQIFFSVALDPTEIGHQGPDWGSQYRSELFVEGPAQARVARAYIAELDAAHVFARPIATRVDPAGPFYPAEGYHQDFLVNNPDNPYIVINDMPKVAALQRLFPGYWQAAPVLVAKGSRS